MQVQVKVGILGHGFIDWAGGIDLLRLVCSSLFATGDVELHLLVPTKGPRLSLARLYRHGKQVAKTIVGRSANAPQILDKKCVYELADESDFAISVHEIDIGDRAIESAAKRLKLNVLLPAFAPLKNSRTPWVGYLFDFQHKYLPHFFTEEEIAHRDREFEYMLNTAATVIVNAKAVAADIERFYPKRKAQVFALPFAAAPDPRWFDLEAPLERYGIREPYVMISNQFWVHKDHETAFHAFAIFARAFPEVQLVCTGSTADYRAPSYFEDLMATARRVGIEDKLKVLGMIPKHDQIGLMRKARAVLQPTLFEGGPGGGSVYDALSLGTPVIVSDIPVNRELIGQENVTFFRSRDPEDLSRVMFEEFSRPRSRVSPEILVELGRERRVSCGHVLLSACGAACAH